MRDIEKIKKQGAHQALRDEINNYQFQLTNRTFNNHINSANQFTNLENCLIEAQKILMDMRKCLEALQRDGARDK